MINSDGFFHLRLANDPLAEMPWLPRYVFADGWGENLSKALAQDFGARWALLLLPYEGAEELRSRDPSLHEEYREIDAVLYRVNLSEEPRQTGPS